MDAILEVIQRGLTCIIDVEPHVGPHTATQSINSSLYLCIPQSINQYGSLFLLVTCLSLPTSDLPCDSPLQNIQLLRTSSLKPFVIFIRFPGPERLRIIRKDVSGPTYSQPSTNQKPATTLTPLNSPILFSLPAGGAPSPAGGDVPIGGGPLQTLL